MKNETESVADVLVKMKAAIRGLGIVTDVTWLEEFTHRIQAAQAREAGGVVAENEMLRRACSKLESDSTRHKDALDHIARVCFGARTSTRRTRWIIERAKSAINNDHEWRLMKRPKNDRSPLEHCATHPSRVDNVRNSG